MKSSLTSKNITFRCCYSQQHENEMQHPLITQTRNTVIWDPVETVTIQNILLKDWPQKPVNEANTAQKEPLCCQCLK